MPSDDLVKRLRDLDEEISAYVSEPVAVRRFRQTIREAATRLSAQPAEVEAVRCDECGARLWTEDAIAVRPSGAEMRERAVQVCVRLEAEADASAAKFREMGDHENADVSHGYACGVMDAARAIRALPLSPEEEGRT
jgi:hypothetical protein